MASQIPPQKGVAYTFYIALVSQSDTDVNVYATPFCGGICDAIGHLPNRIVRSVV